MKNTIKGYVIGVISTILVIGCITAFAANTTTLHNVVVNGIEIFVEGKKINPVDVNGKKVDPIIYNGTTYLPVRAVADAFGKAVYWDGPNYTVYLGKAPVPGELPYPTAYLKDLTNIGNQELKPTSTSQLTDNYGNTYSESVQIVEGYVEFLTDMKYSKFKATIYRPKKSTNGTRFIKIIADGKTIYTSPALDKTSRPVDIEVDITGYNDIKIESCNTLDEYVREPVVTLANAGFYQ